MDKLDSLRIEELYDLSLEYQCIKEFTQLHHKMNYVQFDYYTVHDLTLFVVEPDLNLDSIKDHIDKISKALPAIKKIFAKPVLHLKENDEILPVEAVRIINNNTIQHISRHSELWDNVKNDEIQPLKLLTKVYQDNYGIYENLVFCALMDEILFYTRRVGRYIKNLIYSNQSIDINLLERVNHMQHFLALGKLHTGYLRNFDNLYYPSKICLSNLNYISNIITARLKRPVYRKNKIRPKKFKLHKTNILSMHKDYNKVYRLMSYFEKDKIRRSIDFNLDESHQIEKNYFDYCMILSLFSIGHFNFTIADKQSIDFKKMNVSFTFKKWKTSLSVRTHENIPYLLLEVHKDIDYLVALIPSIFHDNKHIKERFESLNVEERIICTPYEPEEENAKECFLSISNIESFRRIQQILLRAMIHADQMRRDCPFCNQSLLPTGTGSLPIFECDTCRTQIIDFCCPTTMKHYAVTKIVNLPQTLLRKNQFSTEDKWLYLRKREAQMHFRNITDLNEEGQIICPECHKVHPF